MTTKQSGDFAAALIFESKNKRMESYGVLAGALGLGYAVSGRLEFKIQFFIAFMVLAIIAFEVYFSVFKIKLKIFERHFEVFRGRRFVSRVDFSDIQSCSLYRVVNDNGRFGKSVRYLASAYTRSGFAEFRGKEEYFKLKEIISQSRAIHAIMDSKSQYGKMKIEGYSEIGNQFVDGFEVTVASG